jgi:pimeloyl-ACP methyl ester carboxylesterase
MIYIDPTPEKLKELELNHPPSLTDVVIGESFNIFLKWGSQIGVLKLITHVAPNLADGIAGAHLSSWDLLFAGQREYIQRSFGEFEDASLIKNIPIPSENIPFTVLSARESLDFAPELFEMREDLCHLSKACRHVVVENSSHDVMGDQPEMVIREILRFVQ